MTPPTTILVGRIGKVFWLRVEGRATFQNAVQVKRALQAVVAAGMRNLVVDLERCPEERRQACVQLENCTERGAICKEEQTHHVLQAHQALASLSGVNQGRFRDVIQFLEKELEGAPAAATS